MYEKLFHGKNLGGEKLNFPEKFVPSWCDSDKKCPLFCRNHATLYEVIVMSKTKKIKPKYRWFYFLNIWKKKQLLDIWNLWCKLMLILWHETEIYMGKCSERESVLPLKSILFVAKIRLKGFDPFLSGIISLATLAGFYHLFVIENIENAFN